MGTFMFNEPGKGNIIVVGKGSAGVISIPGISSGSVIITNIGVSYETNTQFMPTLGNAIYVNSFGDKVGVCEIQGVIPRIACSSSLMDISKFLTEYKANKFSTSKQLVKITMAGTSISGFLVGVNISTLSQEAQLYGFTLRYATII